MNKNEPFLFIQEEESSHCGLNPEKHDDLLLIQLVLSSQNVWRAHLKIKLSPLPDESPPTHSETNTRWITSCWKPACCSGSVSAAASCRSSRGQCQPDKVQQTPRDRRTCGALLFSLLLSGRSYCTEHNVWIQIKTSQHFVFASLEWKPHSRTLESDLEHIARQLFYCLIEKDRIINSIFLITQQEEVILTRLSSSALKCLVCSHVPTCTPACCGCAGGGRRFLVSCHVTVLILASSGCLYWVMRQFCITSSVYTFSSLVLHVVMANEASWTKEAFQPITWHAPPRFKCHMTTRHHPHEVSVNTQCGKLSTLFVCIWRSSFVLSSFILLAR